MRSKLGNAVRKEFESRLSQRLPQFRPVKPERIEIFGKMEQEIPPGWRLYLWHFREDLYFYLLLVIGPQKLGDAFTVECAWTRNARFPALADLMEPYDIPRCNIVHDEPKDGDFKFRIGTLWEPRADHWWWVAPRMSFEEFSKWVRSEEFKQGLPEPEMSIEDALRNVNTCVEDAVNHIVEYAMPYFEHIIEEYT